MKNEAPVQAIADGLLGEPNITEGKMFGSPVFKVNNKVFAMLVKGELVVKLPGARVEALIASGRGVNFDPGHGRLMKEWVAVGPPPEDWMGLATEARDFVAGAKRFR